MLGVLDEDDMLFGMLDALTPFTDDDDHIIRRLDILLAYFLNVHVTVEIVWDVWD